MDLSGCKPRILHEADTKSSNRPEPSRGYCAPLWQRAGFWFILLSSAGIIAESHNLRLSHVKIPINGSVVDATVMADLPDANSGEIDMFYQMAKNKTVDALQDGYTGLAYVCRGVLGYETSEFILQAQAASAILSDIRINGYPLVVTWETTIDTKNLNIPWIYGGDYTAIFNNNKQSIIQTLDPNNDACIVGIETSQSLGAANILGLAAECGACTVEYNKLFMVGTNIEDSITFATILHEVLHLFCALHTTTGVMRPYMTEDSNMAMIPASTIALIENMLSQNGAPCVTLASDFDSYSSPEKNDPDDSDDTNIYIALGVSLASVSIVGFVLI